MILCFAEVGGVIAETELSDGGVDTTSTKYG